MFVPGINTWETLLFLNVENHFYLKCRHGNVPVIAGGLEPSIYHNVANTIAPVVTISSSGANAGFVNIWGVPVWSSDSSYIDSEMSRYVYFWYAYLKGHQNIFIIFKLALLNLIYIQVIYLVYL